MSKHVWKRIDEASELTGLSEAAILASNDLLSIPPIKKKPDGFYYVEYLDLLFCIKMEGLRALEDLVAFDDEDDDEQQF